MQTLRQTVFGAIVKQEIAFFDKNKTGELVNRLSADTSLVSQSVTMNISDGLRSTVMVVAGVSMMVSRIELVSCQIKNERREKFKGNKTINIPLTFVYSCS